MLGGRWTDEGVENERKYFERLRREAEEERAPPTTALEFMDREAKRLPHSDNVARIEFEGAQEAAAAAGVQRAHDVVTDTGSLTRGSHQGKGSSSTHAPNSDRPVRQGKVDRRTKADRPWHGGLWVS